MHQGPLDQENMQGLDQGDRETSRDHWSQMGGQDRGEASPLLLHDWVGLLALVQQVQAAVGVVSTKQWVWLLTYGCRSGSDNKSGSSWCGKMTMTFRTFTATNGLAPAGIVPLGVPPPLPCWLAVHEEPDDRPNCHKAGYDNASNGSPRQRPFTCTIN